MSISGLPVTHHVWHEALDMVLLHAGHQKHCSGAPRRSRARPGRTRSRREGPCGTLTGGEWRPAGPCTEAAAGRPDLQRPAPGAVRAWHAMGARRWPVQPACRALGGGQAPVGAPQAACRAAPQGERRAASGPAHCAACQARAWRICTRPAAAHEGCGAYVRKERRRLYLRAERRLAAAV